MRMQRVRVRIKLATVSLIDSFKLAIALGYARNRDALIRSLMSTSGGWLITLLQFAALVLKNQDHVVCNPEEVCSAVCDRFAFFIL